MLESEAFRELLIADVALLRGLAPARDVAAAIQRYWEERGKREVSVVEELVLLARLPREALAPVVEEVDRLIQAAGGDPLLALTRHGGLERSMNPSLASAADGATGVPLHTLDPKRYANFALAGRGGMGAVYMALDTEMNRLVAFKVVRTDHADPTARDPGTSPLAAVSPSGEGTPASEAFETLRVRFLQEAWITGGMEHPGIVPVYEMGQTPGGVPFYTMRFVRGRRTLAQAIEELQGRPLEDRLALLEPFLKLCDTVCYAHAKGVVHRDLKPENVALGEFGEVVLLDWGLAKLTGREDHAASRWQAQVREFREAEYLHTATGFIGTPGYMAPEAALGRVREVDARSDVYSLGAILFEILAGRRPHEFATFGEFLAKVTQTEAPSARDMVPAVPEALAVLCARCLARDRDARPATAGDLAGSVRAWQSASALDREVEGLFRDARAALEAAECAEADARLVQVERAAGFLQQVEAKAPREVGLTSERLRLASLRERAVKERERASGRRLLRRVGAGGLAITAVAAFVVASVLEGKRREAEDARAATETARAEAQRAYEDVLRLSDSKRVRDLEDRAARFTIAQPDLEAATTAWLKEADDLAARRVEHERVLGSLRGRATPGRVGWHFGDDRIAWQHDVLADLVDRLAALEAAESPVRARVRRLGDLALALRTSLDSEAVLWRRTIDAIASAPRYGGLTIAPQRGLVPLGADPQSGLFEFALLGSGNVPARDATTGRLVTTDDFSLVLVLLPGGTFLMGAQSVDPKAPGYDPDANSMEAPVREVRISPFMLSKYECTQAQWASIADGAHPSYHRGPRRPVEQISWDEARKNLREFGLDLPTEAQWEYACRAGTTTPWWTGRDEDRLTEAAWVGGPIGSMTHDVGDKAGNAFGLYDVHGNVWEWCLDSLLPYGQETGSDPVIDAGPGRRVLRSGAGVNVASASRSAMRHGADPWHRYGHIGVRPSRTLAR